MERWFRKLKRRIFCGAYGDDGTIASNVNSIASWLTGTTVKTKSFSRKNLIKKSLLNKKTSNASSSNKSGETPSRAFGSSIFEFSHMGFETLCGSNNVVEVEPTENFEAVHRSSDASNSILASQPGGPAPTNPREQSSNNEVCSSSIPDLTKHREQRQQQPRRQRTPLKARKAAKKLSAIFQNKESSHGEEQAARFALPPRQCAQSQHPIPIREVQLDGKEVMSAVTTPSALLRFSRHPRCPVEV